MLEFTVGHINTWMNEGHLRCSESSTVPSKFNYTGAVPVGLYGYCLGTIKSRPPTSLLSELYSMKYNENKTQYSHS